MNSTALKPASAAALKRSRNGCSVKTSRKVGGETGHDFSSTRAFRTAHMTSSGLLPPSQTQRLSVRASAGFFWGSHILALLDRQLGVQAEDFLKLVHALDLRPHRDVGDALKE